MIKFKNEYRLNEILNVDPSFQFNLDILRLSKFDYSKFSVLENCSECEDIVVIVWSKRNPMDVFFNDREQRVVLGYAEFE